MNTRIRRCPGTHARTHIQTHNHTHTHAHAHAHARTHTHTHTHTHTQVDEIKRAIEERSKRSLEAGELDAIIKTFDVTKDGSIDLEDVHDIALALSKVCMRVPARALACLPPRFSCRGTQRCEWWGSSCFRYRPCDPRKLTTRLLWA